MSPSYLLPAATSAAVSVCVAVQHRSGGTCSKILFNHPQLVPPVFFLLRECADDVTTVANAPVLLFSLLGRVSGDHEQRRRARRRRRKDRDVLVFSSITAGSIGSPSPRIVAHRPSAAAVRRSSSLSLLRGVVVRLVVIVIMSVVFLLRCWWRRARSRNLRRLSSYQKNDNSSNINGRKKEKGCPPRPPPTSRPPRHQY